MGKAAIQYIHRRTQWLSRNGHRPRAGPDSSPYCLLRIESKHDRSKAHIGNRANLWQPLFNSLLLSPPPLVFPSPTMRLRRGNIRHCASSRASAGESDGSYPKNAVDCSRYINQEVVRLSHFRRSYLLSPRLCSRTHGADVII